MQLPPLHCAAACAKVHVLPQLPQLSGSTSEFTSQPFEAEPSQSAQPISQRLIVQVPFKHLASACEDAHLVPHTPQLFRSVFNAASQPSALRPLQSS
jgi:hypothetical protein